MPDDPKPAEPAAAPPQDAAAEPAAAKAGAAVSEDSTGGAPAAGEPPPEVDVEALKKERDGLKDQLLRALAETENVRKRADREKADMAKFAITRFARDVVDVGDSFQHAISAVTAEAADKDPALKSFLEGVTLAERAFLAALERHGVQQINPSGELFNPHLHHAASEEENLDIAAGTITKVYQVGYVLEERVLRPAMVVVARGGKKPAPDETIKPANENTVGETEPASPTSGGDAEQKAG